MTTVPGVDPGWDTGPTDHVADGLDTGAAAGGGPVT